MLPKRFLFNYCVPIKEVPQLWTSKGAPLDASYGVVPLERLEPPRKPSVSAELRIGWNKKGLCFSLIVEGKKTSPWCRTTQPEESDGLHLCIDTRDVRNVHRASRFCHRLVFLPGGNGDKRDQPSIFWFPIHRAKAHPAPVEVERLKASSHYTADGYQLDGAIPAEVLTGFDPSEHPRIGFHYYLIDRELGNIGMLLEEPFPHDYDPSLWSTLEMKAGQSTER